MVIILLGELTTDVRTSPYRGTTRLTLPEQVTGNRCVVIRHRDAFLRVPAGDLPPQLKRWDRRRAGTDRTSGSGEDVTKPQASGIHFPTHPASQADVVVASANLRGPPLVEEPPHPVVALEGRSYSPTAIDTRCDRGQPAERRLAQQESIMVARRALTAKYTSRGEQRRR
jgi:hypothetical protein